MTNLGSRRLTAAKLGGESFDLAAGFFERAGTVDFLGGRRNIKNERKLGGDAATGFDFTETTREKALDLLLGMAPGDHQAVETFVNAGFDQQGGFDEDRVADSGAPPHLELAEDDFRDARMDDGVEAVELSAVGEDDGAELCAVDRSEEH